MSKGMPLIHKPPVESNVHLLTTRVEVGSFQPTSLVSTSMSLLYAHAVYHSSMEICYERGI